MRSEASEERAVAQDPRDVAEHHAAYRSVLRETRGSCRTACAGPTRDRGICGRGRPDGYAWRSSRARCRRRMASLLSSARRSPGSQLLEGPRNARPASGRSRVRIGGRVRLRVSAYPRTTDASRAVAEGRRVAESRSCDRILWRPRLVLWGRGEPARRGATRCTRDRRIIDQARTCPGDPRSSPEPRRVRSGSSGTRASLPALVSASAGDRRRGANAEDAILPRGGGWRGRCIDARRRRAAFLRKRNHQPEPASLGADCGCARDAYDASGDLAGLRAPAQQDPRLTVRRRQSVPLENQGRRDPKDRAARTEGDDREDHQLRLGDHDEEERAPLRTLFTVHRSPHRCARCRSRRLRPGGRVSEGRVLGETRRRSSDPCRGVLPPGSRDREARSARVRNAVPRTRAHRVAPRRACGGRCRAGIRATPPPCGRSARGDRPCRPGGGNHPRS